VDISVPDLPDEPLPLSYLVAATVIAEISDRQALLAARTRWRDCRPNRPCCAVNWRCSPASTP